jgi:hypothetical protein
VYSVLMGRVWEGGGWRILLGKGIWIGRGDGYLDGDVDVDGAGDVLMIFSYQTDQNTFSSTERVWRLIPCVTSTRPTLNVCNDGEQHKEVNAID